MSDKIREYIVPIVCRNHGHIKIHATSREDADEKLKQLTNARLLRFFKSEYTFVTRGKAKEIDDSN